MQISRHHVPPSRLRATFIHQWPIRAGRAARPRPLPAGRGRRPCPAVTPGPQVRALGVAGDTRGRGETGHSTPGFGDSPPRPSLPTEPAGGAGDRSQLSATAPGTGGAAGHPKGVQHLQQGGEIPLGSLGPPVIAPGRGHPSSEPGTGQRMISGL